MTKKKANRKVKPLTYKERLKKMLVFLKEGNGIELGVDTFLCGIELDGSDKVYGFKKKEGELLVVTRECSSGYSISNMDEEDLNYMFELSNISKKIKEKKYEIVESDQS